MQERVGNLWDFYSLGSQHIACITTNGVVKANGECVMGRGCAREACDRFKGFARMVGDSIKTIGNHVCLFDKFGLVTFPTKNDWRLPSDIELIKQSADELAFFADIMPDNIFYLPRPGCGNGGLKWSDVKPIIAPILPDNVIVVSYEQAGVA